MPCFRRRQSSVADSCARHFADCDAAGRDYDITTNQMIWPSDLDAALAAQGVALESGDILLLRTGWAGYYLELSPDEQGRFRGSGFFAAPGR